MTSYLKVILKPAKCKFTWIQLIRVFSTKRKYGVVWNIYSPCLWKTACNLKCTQLRIAHYATMYQSQSVCISRPCSRGTVFFTKHVVCAFQRAVMVSHPEPLIFALHTQWTQLKGCTDSLDSVYNIVHGVKTYKSWVTRARVHCRIWQSASTARWANPKFHPNPVQHLASVFQNPILHLTCTG